MFCKQPEHMLVYRDFVPYQNQQLILVQFIKYETGIMWLRVYNVSKCKRFMYMYVNKRTERTQ